MRAVVVSPGPEFSVMDVYNGWISGLQANGVEVIPFNLHDRLNFFTEALLKRNGEIRKAFSLEAAVENVFEGLQSTLYRAWPDIIVMVSGFFFDEHLFDDILRNRPHKVVMIHTESPYEDDRQLGLAPHVHVNVLNDPINLDQFKQVNPRSLYLPHAYDPKLHHPDGRSDDFDFLFVGTGYPSRIDYLEAMDFRGSRVGLAGNWQALEDDSPLHRYLLHPQGHCVDNFETADLYRASNMSANLYRREASRPELSTGWAMGPREVELAACGTFFARDPRGEGDELFPMLPKVTGPEELSDVIAWSIAHPDERQVAADAARAAVADRTFEANAAELLRLIAP